jgi:hypothetical protein
MPDPSRFHLPWNENGSRWYDALEKAVAGLFTQQRRGSFASRADGPEWPMPPWCRHGKKDMASQARYRAPLFSPQRSSPCFMLPSPDLLRALAARPLVEVGAGSGVWALLVAAAGGDIVATDPRPWAMGRAYDFRGTPDDAPFSGRHRRKRGRSARLTDCLRKEYKGALDNHPTRFSLASAGPARMRFGKVWRHARVLRPEPGFAPIRRMGAIEAAAAFPGRDLLMVMPDPADDGWAWRLLRALEPGRRVWHQEDWGDSRPADGYSLLSEFPVRSFGRDDAHTLSLSERRAG